MEKPNRLISISPTYSRTKYRSYLSVILIDPSTFEQHPCNHAKHAIRGKSDCFAWCLQSPIFSYDIHGIHLRSSFSSRGYFWYGYRFLRCRLINPFHLFMLARGFGHFCYKCHLSTAIRYSETDYYNYAANRPARLWNRDLNSPAIGHFAPVELSVVED